MKTVIFILRIETYGGWDTCVLPDLYRINRLFNIAVISQGDYTTTFTGKPANLRAFLRYYKNVYRAQPKGANGVNAKFLIA